MPDNRLGVPAAYPLQAFDQEKAAWEMRTAPYNSRSKKVKGRVAQNKPLAPIIDAMLLAGGHTMQGILREVRRRASAASRGKDLAANVRARMVSYTRKGWQVVKDDEKRVKLVQKAV
ncbi:MAG TPA: hypothetical protein DCZ01_11290 [Elusimicrobia bacterium]|nr:MAG: hypothetical protein A2X40_03435 [Elusimicrobia bacterium GWC2_65_9]HAZ09076.1 hypothetical protein [Elusimicrobiota bacterium]